MSNIHFVGIGGIGISALARIYHQLGKRVTGSDLAVSEVTEALKQEGIKVSIGHRPENLLQDTEAVVYSSAVPTDNPERVEARKRGIPELSYPEGLGQFARGKKVIAVAGTNGKTTTTAMIATVLERVGLDPTAIVGSEVLAWKSNARVGKSKYLVLEADEYCRAFLNYPADIAVITNIAADHLDYFGDFEDVKHAFTEFSQKIKPGGILVYNQSDGSAVEIAGKLPNGVIARPFAMAEAISLKVPGKFNLENAGAAAAACEVLGVSQEDIKKGLASFTGTWRRFEKIGKYESAEIISDYAHHPDGIKVTLQTAFEEYPGKRILGVFQPHQHNRTKTLFDQFVKVFCQSKLADFIIAEIFEVAGREAVRDQDISSRDLVREVEKCGKKVVYAQDLDVCERKVRAVSKNYDIIVIMGAGDIYKVANKLVDTNI